MRSLRYTDLAGEQKGSFPNHGSLEVKDFGRTCGQISRPEHVTMPAPPVYFALCVYHPPPRTFGDSANGDLSRGQGRPPVGGAAEEESRRSRSLNTPVGSDTAGGPPAASSGRTAETAYVPGVSAWRRRVREASGWCGRVHVRACPATPAAQRPEDP